MDKIDDRKALDALLEANSRLKNVTTSVLVHGNNVAGFMKSQKSGLTQTGIGLIGADLRDIKFVPPITVDCNTLYQLCKTMKKATPVSILHSEDGLTIHVGDDSATFPYAKVMDIFETLKEISDITVDLAKDMDLETIELIYDKSVPYKALDLGEESTIRLNKKLFGAFKPKDSIHCKLRSNDDFKFAEFTSNLKLCDVKMIVKFKHITQEEK